MAGQAVANGYNISQGIIIATPSSTFTRPANTTAYATNQIIANSATAASVTPLIWNIARVPNGTLLIRRVKLFKTTNNLTGATFNVHFYASSPTAANGDGGALSTSFSNWLGFIPVALTTAFTDPGSAGVGQVTAGLELNCATLAGSMNIYGLLQATTAYTPGSAEAFTVYPEAWIN